MTNTPCNDWAGISCNEGGSITKISRSAKNLSGTLPDLSVLTQLQRLDLSKNQLGGTIPNLSTLTQLKELFLDQNQFTGSIPDVSALTQLEWLLLSSNQLTGTIPNLSALTQLQYLYLGGNPLSGSIPHLNALTQLRELDLETSQLGGTIPDLSPLTQLQLLNLRDNQLSGEIPLSLATLNNLISLSIDNNHLTTCDPSLTAFLNSNSPGWTNQNSKIDCSQKSSNAPPSHTGTQTVTLNVTVEGLGKVNDTEGNIECGRKCGTSYTIHLSSPRVTLIPTVLSGRFSGWSGDCTRSSTTFEGDQISFSIADSHSNQKMSCTASFTTVTPLPLISGLVVKVDGTGDGKVTGNGIDCTKNGGTCYQTYPTGTLITLVTTVSSDTYFSSWGGDGDCADGQVQLLGSVQCVAHFRKLPKLTISKAGIGEGTVTSQGIDCGTACAKDYPPDTQITLLPKAVSGSSFSHWEGHEDCLDGQVQMSEDKSCVAYFQSSPELKVKIVGKGSVKGGEVDCNQECVKAYPRDTQVTLAAIPTPGYYFQRWSEACTETSPIVTVTMDQAKTCVANFDLESNHPPLDELEKLLVSSNHKDILEQPEVENLNTLSDELLVVAQTTVQNYQNATQMASNEERVEPLDNFESQIKPLQDQVATISMLAQNIMERLQTGEMFLSQVLVNNMTDEELARVLGETGLKAHVEAGLISPIRAQTISQLGLPAFNQNFLDFGGFCAPLRSPTSYLDSVLDIFVPKAEASAILGCLSICRASFNQTCLNCVISKGATVVSEVRNLITEWNKCSGWFKWVCRAIVAAKILWVIA